MHIVINLLILIAAIVIGIPIPFAFMAAALYMGFMFFPDFSFLTTVGFRSLNSLILLSIPLFIMAGSLMGSAGIAVRLVDFAQSILGRIRGGMGAAVVVSCAIFGAIAGTCSAAVACIGTIMIPRLEKLGYPRHYTTALVACSSVLGQLFPPSVPMILFAWVTQQSVAACFLSTVIPGLIIMVNLIIVNHFYCKKFPDIKVDSSISFRESSLLIARSTRRGIWSLIMPAIIIGGIYGGIATPTESAAIAVGYSVVIGFFVHRELSIKSLWKALCVSATTSGVICMMLFFIAMLGRLYAMEQVPQRLADYLLGISDNRIVILLMVNLFLIIIGMLMDDLSGTLLTAALLMPLMREIGVHPIHFAAIMGTNMGMGNVTPPCAPLLYLAARIGNVPFNQYITPTLVFMLVAQLPVVLLVTFVPELALWLPRLVMGIR